MAPQFNAALVPSKRRDFLRLVKNSKIFTRFVAEMPDLSADFVHRPTNCRFQTLKTIREKISSKESLVMGRHAVVSSFVGWMKTSDGKDVEA
jgi:hypothetical protein